MNLLDLKKKARTEDAFTLWFEFGTFEPVKNQISKNLYISPPGKGNKSRRRIAYRNRFQTIRARVITSIEGCKHCYYFDGSLDVPGSPPVTSASDSRIFYPGDIVEVDTQGKPEGGWGRIIRLVDTSGRRDGEVDTVWDFTPDEEIKNRFPLPKNLSNATQLENVEIWKNKAGALITIRFVPAHWTVMNNIAQLDAPRLEFVKMEIFNPSSEYEIAPHGYLHFSHIEKFHVVSEIFQQDDFSRKLDEFFIARLWNGGMREFGKINLPGIGASIQKRHFTRMPHEILGKEVYYA